jgi:hypothetical protein
MADTMIGRCEWYAKQLLTWLTANIAIKQLTSCPSASSATDRTNGLVYRAVECALNFAAIAAPPFSELKGEHWTKRKGCGGIK